MRTASLFLLAALVSATQASTGARAAESAVCGPLPYREAGDDRFSGPRAIPDEKATVGPQFTYPFAWDLARPAFVASAIAEALETGMSAKDAAAKFGAPMSLSEYMLFAAKQFEAAPPPPADGADIRVRLAASRPETFHRIYLLSKESFDGAAALLREEAGAAERDGLIAKTTSAWRRAYVLIAAAQANDKRIELLDTGLDDEAALAIEAVACIADAIAAAAADAPGAAAAARAAAARWPERPAVNVRKLPKAAREPFFAMEDAGDEIEAAFKEMEGGPISDANFRTLAKAYATFAEAAREFHENRKSE